METEAIVLRTPTRCPSWPGAKAPLKKIRVKSAGAGNIPSPATGTEKWSGGIGNPMPPLCRVDGRNQLLLLPPKMRRMKRKRLMKSR